MGYRNNRLFSCCYLWFFKFLSFCCCCFNSDVIQTISCFISYLCLFVKTNRGRYMLCLSFCFYLLKQFGICNIFFLIFSSEVYYCLSVPNKIWEVLCFVQSSIAGTASDLIRYNTSIRDLSSSNRGRLLNQVVFKLWRIQVLCCAWCCCADLALFWSSLYVVIHPLIKSKALAFSIFVKVKCFQTKLKQPIVLSKQLIVCT